MNEITDFDLRVSLGLHGGLRHITVNGENLDVSAAAEESIISAGGVYVFPTVSETLNVVSTSASDTAAGVGARTVRIEGLDVGFAPIFEDVVLNGTTIVLTTKSFFRVNRVFVTSSGTSTFNVGIISCTQSTSTLVVRTIATEHSIDGDCVYTVPLNNTLYCRRLRYTATTAAGTNPVITFKFYVTVGGTRFLANEIFMDTSDQAIYDDYSYTTDVITQTSDIVLAADTDKNNTQCKIQLRCILVIEEELN